MGLTTQVSGQYLTENSAIFRIKAKLQQFGIDVTHPANDGFIFTQKSLAPTVLPAIWTPYEATLDYFQSLPTDDFYVVSNDNGLVSESVARGILYAMLQRKPIVLLQKPAFDDEVSIFARELIEANLPKMTVRNILDMPETEAQDFLQNLDRPVEYQLTNQEQSRIQAELRAHFRALLNNQA